MGSGKMKKIKKYEDQDEEDKIAMMELMHGTSKNKKKQSKKEQKPERKTGSERGQTKKKETKTGNVFQRANEELPPPPEMELENGTSNLEESRETAAVVEPEVHGDSDD